MAPKQEKQSTNVFIKDEVYGWRPAVQEKINGDKAIVTVPEYPSEQSMACDGGRAAKKGNQITISLKDYPSGVLPLQNVDANGNLVECADMVKLPYLHEVRQRKLFVLPNQDSMLTYASYSLCYTLPRQLSCTI